MILTVQVDIAWFITLQMIQISSSYISSVKRKNNQVNQDLKNLLNWLNVNRICLNISETEVVSFKSSRKLTDVPLNSNLMGKN